MKACLRCKYLSARRVERDGVPPCSAYPFGLFIALSEAHPHDYRGDFQHGVKTIVERGDGWTPIVALDTCTGALLVLPSVGEVWVRFHRFHPWQGRLMNVTVTAVDHHSKSRHRPVEYNSASAGVLVADARSRLSRLERDNTLMSTPSPTAFVVVDASAHGPQHPERDSDLSDYPVLATTKRNL